MGGIPLELITMLGSGLLSGVMTIWSQNQKAKQAAFDRAIEKHVVMRIKVSKLHVVLLH
jgi:hypothetical protein